MALFSGEGWLFLLRWFHFLAGITWIGMLYYFNFVQTPFFATADSPVRTGMIAGSLVGRALWWFRWGAMLTFITGWLYILHRIGQLGLLGFFQTSYGWAIFIGGIIGSLMWFNVWFVIWPAQKVVIASATQVAKGGQANPAAAPRGQRSGFTSRTNTLLSIPMLFFIAIVLAIVEANALVGTTGPGKKMLGTVTGTLWGGFVLAAILVILLKLIFQ